MSKWRVGIDVGGTFTDLVAINAGGGQQIHLKVSTNVQDPAAGFMEAIGALRREAGIEPGQIETIFHGTTLATNAIIERNISRTALVTTKGFRDILEIGRHWREDLYDLDIDRPAPLVPRLLRFEVDERVAADGSVVTPLSDAEIDRVVDLVLKADVEAVGVTLLHAYANPEHEDRIVRRLREASKGKIYVSSGSELSREPREFERTSTTVLNAALMRLIDDYLLRIEMELKSAGEMARLYVTHSNGGALAPAAARRRPVSLAQSGPVAGVQSCLRMSKELGFDNLIAFDIGGTSTDIALIENGVARIANEIDVGGLPVRLPAVQVYSIGAGGGSIADVDDVGALSVGPKSARASPGPACYGRGGELATVTDAHAVLGRLPADYPLGGFLKLDVRAAFEAVGKCVAAPLKIETDKGAQAIIDVINAKMEGAIRVLLRERGGDPRDFALVAFGGAGPLHAVELAKNLGIETVIVPRHPGTFSAFGLLTSDLRHEFAISRPIRSNDPQAGAKLEAAYAELEVLALSELKDDPDFSRGVDRERRCDMRYLGQAYDVSVPLRSDPSDAGAWAELGDAFHEEHRRAYAFAEPKEPCELRTQRLSLTVRVGSQLELPRTQVRVGGSRRIALVNIDGARVECPAIDRASLVPGSVVPSPSLVIQDDATTFIPPGVRATVAATGDLMITDISR